MRIAYLCMDPGVPVLGTKGASAHVRGVVEAMHRTGHDVLLVASSMGAGGATETACPALEIPPEVWLERACKSLEEPPDGERALANDVKNLLFAPEFARQAQPHLERFRPDVIYERYALFGTAGAQLASRLGVPVLLEVNAPRVIEREYKNEGNGLRSAARASERSVLCAADHVCVVSDWLERHARAQGVDAARISVLPNAADPVLFRPLPLPDWRRRMRWQEAFVVGCVGGMKLWHDMRTVVEAFALLRRDDDRYRLVLVGDGPQFDSIRERVADLDLEGSVLMQGSVQQDAVPNWLAGMDACIVPLAEHAPPYFCPVKLFEYMAAGRAVVAARRAEAAAIIDAEVTGLFFEPGAPGTLAGQIRRLAHDLPLRRRLADAARSRALTHHTWEARTAEVVRIADGVLSARQAATPTSVLEAVPGHRA